MKLVRLISLLLISCILSMTLAEVYTMLGSIVQPLWLAVAVVNTVLAAAVYVIGARQNETVFISPRSLPYSLAFLPTWLVLGFAVLAPLVTRAFAGGAGSQVDITFFSVASVLWIPYVEEMVFRIGIGSYLRRRAGVVLGAYLSALVFALTHSLPTWQRLEHGEIGLPLGAFLLGLTNEFLYVKWRRVVPLVTLHAACNLAGILFFTVDARWLEWLRPLFL